MKTKALVFAAAVSWFFGLEARAQSGPCKFELGGQFVGFSAHSTRFPSSTPGLINDIDDLVLGGGIRAGYRIAKNIAVEAEVNVFQRPPTDDPATLGKWSQGFFGLKVSKHLVNIGVFGKFRPGFARFDGITSVVRLPDGSVNIRLIKDNTFFSLDIGGGIELYPSQRTIVRLDGGDAIIRYTGRPGNGIDPISNPAPRTYYGHNFQFSMAFAVRF